jgi:hypothetical protein
MTNKNLYIVSVLFIIVSLLFGNFLQDYFSEKYRPLLIRVGFTFFSVLIFTLIYYIFFYNSKENFFFEVSKCNPKCSGAYYGKPATFQFTPLSVNGTTCPDKNCGYGMISECKYPECKERLNKYGGPSPKDQL